MDKGLMLLIVVNVIIASVTFTIDAKWLEYLKYQKSELNNKTYSSIYEVPIATINEPSTISEIMTFDQLVEQSEKALNVATKSELKEREQIIATMSQVSTPSDISDTIIKKLNLNSKNAVIKMNENPKVLMIGDERFWGMQKSVRADYDVDVVSLKSISIKDFLKVVKQIDASKYQYIYLSPTMNNYESTTDFYETNLVKIIEHFVNDNIKKSVGYKLYYVKSGFIDKGPLTTDKELFFINIEKQLSSVQHEKFSLLDISEVQNENTTIDGYVFKSQRDVLEALEFMLKDV